MTSKTGNLKEHLDGRNNEQSYFLGIFELVEDKENWKNPCSGAFVKREQAERVREAIIFFHAGCEKVQEYSVHGQPFFFVRSLGYNQYTGEC